MVVNIEKHIDVLWEDYFRTDKIEEREAIRLEISNLELKLYRRTEKVQSNVNMINIEILR